MTKPLRRTRHLLLAALAGAAASCRIPEGPTIHLGSLTVAARPPELWLENKVTDPIYFVAMERETATRTEWAPCDQPSACSPPVIRGQLRRLPYGQIQGWTIDAREAVVYYWQMRQQGDGSWLRSPVLHHVVRL